METKDLDRDLGLTVGVAGQNILWIMIYQKNNSKSEIFFLDRKMRTQILNEILTFFMSIFNILFYNLYVCKYR